MTLLSSLMILLLFAVTTECCVTRISGYAQSYNYAEFSGRAQKPQKLGFISYGYFIELYANGALVYDKILDGTYVDSVDFDFDFASCTNYEARINVFIGKNGRDPTLDENGKPKFIGKPVNVNFKTPCT